MEELQKYWSILQRRKIPAIVVFASTFSIAALMANGKKPIYEAKGQLIIKTTDTASAVIGDKLGQGSSGQNNLNTGAAILKSVPVAQETLKKLNLNGVSPEAFANSIGVKTIAGTDLLEITYRDADPKRAAEVINTLMEVYTANDLKANQSEARSARKFIEQQLPNLEKEVQVAEIALRRFKDHNQILNVESEMQSTVQMIATVQGQLQAAQLALATASAKSSSLQSLVGLDPSTAYAVSTPWVQEVLQELQEVEQQLAIERSRFQEESPTILALKDKEENLRGLLRDRFGEDVSGRFQTSVTQQQMINEYLQIEVSRQGLSDQMTDLSAILAQYQERARNLPRLEQQQRELERRLKAAQATYEVLLARLQETRVVENQTTANVQVISPALAGSPLASQKRADLMKGGLLALLLAGAVAKLLDMVDQSIKTTEEAKALAGYPLLGIIPSFPVFDQSAFNLGAIDLGNLNLSQLKREMAANGASDDLVEPIIPELIVKNMPHSRISEAFRMLQTNLKFLNLDKALKSIVITSSVPQEGKSTIAANLAMAIAQLDRKVLLIDADLRNPSQQKIWQLPNMRGLTNVVTGQISCQQAAHQVAPNLQLLTTGMSPPNPVAILDSKRMNELIDSLSQEFDFIIIDSPPITVAADSVLLGKVADGLLLLMRPGVVDYSNFAYAKQVLDQTGQNVLGMVINGVAQEGDPYYYYGYGGYGKKSSGVDEQEVRSPVRANGYGQSN